MFPQQPVEVLLVEDNEGDVSLVRQSLIECDRPVELTVARDGEEALLLLRASDFQPDLVILDLNIPRLSGLAVLELEPASLAVVWAMLANHWFFVTDFLLQFSCVSVPAHNSRTPTLTRQSLILPVRLLPGLKPEMRAALRGSFSLLPRLAKALGRVSYTCWRRR
jgi:hypothetical protein